MLSWLKKLIDVLSGLVGSPKPPAPKPLPPQNPAPPADDGPPHVPTTPTTPAPGTTKPPAPSTTTTKPPPSITLALLDAHNSYRAGRGLPPLSVNNALTLAAQDHATWMAKVAGTLSHTGSGGSSPFDRMRAHGYQYSSAGENIAYGYVDVPSVMSGWIASSGHEANIRGPYADVGFGFASDAAGRVYWVADFAKPAQHGAATGSAHVHLSGPLHHRGEDMSDINRLLRELRDAAHGTAGGQ